MILAITYILISGVLVLGAAFFFSRALKNLNPSASPDQLPIPGTTPYYGTSSREEVIAMLERQFRSSPSSEL
ncbi:MAG: hypothetical protein SFT94_07275 [Pseudanabaenaceae cyanobacterium bins.68]|nr:hypothetical protein [Pseudanabaenaceae cyanobacterium bins.68]